MNAAIADLQSLSSADYDRNRQSQDHSLVSAALCAMQHMHASPAILIVHCKWQLHAPALGSSPTAQQSLPATRKRRCSWWPRITTGARGHSVITAAATMMSPAGGGGQFADMALRRQWLPLRPSWYTGLPDGRGLHDLSWLRRGGQALSDWDWTQSESRVLGALIGAPGRGQRVLLMLFNAEPQDADFKLPPGDWQLLLDSADLSADLSDTPAGKLGAPQGLDSGRALGAGCGGGPLSGSCRLPSRGVLLLAGPANHPTPPPRPGA